MIDNLEVQKVSVVSVKVVKEKLLRGSDTEKFVHFFIMKIDK